MQVCLSDLNELNWKNIRRILIVGNSGSGKTTLANSIGKITGLPVSSMDTFRWRSNWEKVSDKRFKNAIRRTVRREDWIIEGVFPNGVELCAFTADIIIFLNLNPIRCLRNVIIRSFLFQNVARPGLPEGCVEKFNLRFYFLIVFFGLKTKQRILSAIRANPATKWVYLDDHRQSELLLGIFRGNF